MKKTKQFSFFKNRYVVAFLISISKFHSSASASPSIPSSFGGSSSLPWGSGYST